MFSILQKTRETGEVKPFEVFVQLYMADKSRFQRSMQYEHEYEHD